MYVSYVYVGKGGGAYRCERVATSLATVWARVDMVFMWKTGKESLPSFMPRSERMTEMKWMQDELRRGREVDFVRSCIQSVFWSFWSKLRATCSDIYVRNIANDVVLAIKNR
jgi:hypothetical protein